MPRRVTAALTAIAAIALVVLVVAGESRPAERRDSIAERLRCPVCQSESVRDSTSQTATDMQAVIDEQIAAGASDREIIDFFVARYGEWILLDAPARGRTLVLWALPLLVAVAGVGIIASRRRRPDVTANAAVVDEDRRDLARQVAMGEVDDDTASRLLKTYDAETNATAPPLPTSSRGSRAIAGTAVLVVGIAAVAFAVVRATEDRPDGGYATGSILEDNNTQRDLASVSNEEMEVVVAANPDIVPMRLALARRYFDEGDFSSALPHYLHILEIEPDPEALANVGWMAYLNDRADIAQDYLEQSLAVSPGYTQAQFFLANVLLFGLDDPEGAAPLLRQVIASPGLPSDVRREAESLLAQAIAS